MTTLLSVALTVYTAGLVAGLIAGALFGWWLSRLKAKALKWLQDRKFDRDVKRWIREVEEEQRQIRVIE